MLALARVAERWDKRGRAEDFERLAPQLFRRGHGDDIAQSDADRRDLSRLRIAVEKSLEDVGGDWVDPAEVDAVCKRWLEHLQMDPGVPPAKPAKKAGKKKPGKKKPGKKSSKK